MTHTPRMATRLCRIKRRDRRGHRLSEAPVGVTASGLGPPRTTGFMDDDVLAGPRWASRPSTWSHALPGAAPDALAPFGPATADPDKGDAQAAFDARAAASGPRFTLVPASPEASIRAPGLRRPLGRPDRPNQLPRRPVRPVARRRGAGARPGRDAPVPSGTGGPRHAPHSTEPRRVLTQESGHALGLDRSAGPSSATCRGLAHFGDPISRGATPTEIARSMLDGARAASRRGGLSGRDFVASP